MQTGGHVLRISLDQVPVHFNTVTKKLIPPGGDLGKHLCLEGQIPEALETSLLRRPVAASFQVIPTWRCNLRCGHCSVLHQLVTAETDFDADGGVDFIKRYLDAYPVGQCRIHFVGGEPLLKPDVCLRFIREFPRADHTLTTNGYFEPTPDIVEVLDACQHYVVSLDGSETDHNWQRKSFDGGSPYRRTLDFIAAMLDRGHAAKMHVQAAMREQKLSVEGKVEFYRTLLKLGVPKGNIIYAAACPTYKNPKPTGQYLNYLHSPRLNPQPCCKFRHMAYFILDPSRRVLTNFFRADETSQIGTFASPMSEVEAEYKKLLFATMPALNDPNCRSCPAVGFCWGGCVAGEVVVGGRPSQYCDQSGMIALMNRKASENALDELGVPSRPATPRPTPAAPPSA